MSEKLKKCEWAGDDPLYVDYHDKEWGVPVYDDQKLFEFLILETFQAGLSWITVLRKRENFRLAFDNFDFNKLALYDENKIAQLLNNKGIIRNRLKIYAAVNNARAFLEIRKEHGTFSKYIWSFTSGKAIINNFRTIKDIPANTGLSDKISKELKKKGFKFVGSTVIYAYMQATGMLNDHVKECFRYNEINDL